MSGQDPNWEPRGSRRRVRGAEGAMEAQAEHVPEVEDLDQDDPGHVVWIRGRVKNIDGTWKRSPDSRLQKRVYKS